MAPHQVVYVYGSRWGTGADVWFSSEWNDRGQWFAVCHTRYGPDRWLLTRPRSWQLSRWWFVPWPGVPGSSLTEEERDHVDSTPYRLLYGPSLW